MIESIGQKSRKLLGILALIFAIFLIKDLLSPAKAYWKGSPAPDEPEQSDSSEVQPIKIGDYLVEPLARYWIKAVVLSRKSYSYGRESELSPLDLALGWKEMSEAKVINRLRFSQSNRWYRYRWTGEPPLPLENIISQSANVHCIPANRTIRKALLKVKRHMLVELEGYLVAVSGPNGFFWRSSLSRQDSGDGSCELLYVLKVQAQKIKN